LTCLFYAEEFFLDPSSQRETTVDVGKMKEMAQEPATPAKALETFKFIGIGLDKLHIMPKKP